MALQKDSRKEIVIDVIICVMAVFFLLTIAIFRILEPVDNTLYDSFLEVRAGGRIAAENTDIVIVAIDECSLTEMKQRWPWDRTLYAKAIDFLHRAGARVVAIDLLFIDPSKQTAQDKTLSEAMKKAGNVVIAAKLERLEQSLSGNELGLSGQRLVLPLQFFLHTATTGVVNLELGTGSVVRRFKPYYCHQDERLPAFAVEVYNQAFGKYPDLPGTDGVYIDYFGSAGVFPKIPIYQILQKRVKPGVFKNKIVLIGATFSDAHDFFATPLSPADNPSPGVEIQANILGTMIQKEYLAMMPMWPQLIIIAALAALGGYLAMFRSAYYFWAAFITVFTLIVCFSIWMMYKHELLMDLSYPLLALPFTFFLVNLRMRKPLVLDTKVGPYILHEELGHGGMAVVYRATHPKTKEVLALKKMLPQCAGDEEAISRFLRETEMLRQLNHPNIIRIVDVGEVNSCPYYAMELITGTSLDKVLKESGGLTPSEVRQIGGAVARALAEAHRSNIIHRDIKPSNIMMTNLGIPKLTDFGIAKSADSPELTRTGVIVGTPSFLAPELCDGGTPSALSDIYSFGATLYALLTARAPFVAQDFRTTLSMVINKKPIDVRKLCQNIDDELARLVMQCLEKDPKKRPEDMLDLAKALDPFYTDIALKSTVFTTAKTEIPELNNDKTITIPTCVEDKPADVNLNQG